MVGCVVQIMDSLLRSLNLLPMYIWSNIVNIVFETKHLLS